MQRNVFETVLGAVVLLVAAAFVVFFYRTTDIAPKSGYTVTASFSQINGLEPGSPVRISGVKVGQVLDFKLDPKSYNAIVRMNIDNGVKIPDDTAAVVTSEGLLGGKFMSLEPGADDTYLTQGGRIQYTQAAPDLEQMLGKFIFSMSNNKKDSKK